MKCSTALYAINHEKDSFVRVLHIYHFVGLWKQAFSFTQVEQLFGFLGN